MNQFGQIYRIQIFGESHGPYVGVVIDGCPHGISLTEEDFISDINRRKSGQKGTTPRKEDDIPKIISGVFKQRTTGSPIAVIVKNKDIRSAGYEENEYHPRPGHADFTAFKKFSGFNDWRGSGHFSGRLTLPLVVAGVIAKKIISEVKISAKLIEAGGDTNIPNAVDNALSRNDSIGGIIECCAEDIPVGWGEPFFNSVESQIAHLAFAVPAVKGIEFGLGFGSAKMKGSVMNDVILNEKGETATNNAGGVSGGITNGNMLIFKVAVKPASSISIPQETFHFSEKKMKELKIQGRHDACIALRVPVIVEAITAIVLADFKLMNKAMV